MHRPGTKSDSLKEIQSPHGIKNRWEAISKPARIGIVASAASVVAIAACIIAFCCIKQRRAGRKEFAAYEAEEKQKAADLAQHKQQWQSSQRRYTRI